MIVLTDVKAYDTNDDRDWCELINAIEDRLRPYNVDSWIDIHRKARVEYIKGRCFIRPSDGEKIKIIGCSEQVQETLGILYSAWDAMERDLYDERGHNSVLKKELERAYARLEKVETMSLWQRIKMVFKAYEPTRL